MSVLPLWLLYEGLRFTLAPTERNGAEVLVTDALGMFGSHALVVLRVLFAMTVLGAALSILRRELPWGKVALVSALEGCVYGLMLGPVAGALVQPFLDDRALVISSVLTRDLIGSLGAGIFEEAVFRLGLLSLLALLLGKVSRAFSVHEVPGVIAAILFSAVAFSAFHHVGAGSEPYDHAAFYYRTIAGVVLGAMFVLRGFGVCVYAHAVYDLHFYLMHSSG